MATPNPDTRPASRWWHFWHCERCATPAEETRQRLLEAAFEEIHRTGFQAASLHHILQRTRVTKGALYHHFPSKLALGYAVVDELLAAYLDRYWLEPLAAADDPVECLEALLLDNASRMDEGDVVLGCPLNNLAQEMAPVDEGFRIRIQALFDAWRGGIAEALSRGQAAGHVRGDVDPGESATVILATLEGCVGLAKTAQSLSVLKSCGAGLVRYLASLKPQPGAPAHG
jgi:TetR/AcrR family transcriptional repressor of nem operon